MTHKLKVTPKMHEDLMYAANFYGNSAGVVRYCNRRTEDALLRRGLITYDVTVNYSPVITVKGWEYLASKGFDRRADVGRLTLEDALTDSLVIVEEIKEEENMTDTNITPETIEALRVLRTNVRSDETSEAVAQAIVILDNAGIFAAIDEVTGYDVDPEPERCDVTFIGGGRCSKAAGHRPLGSQDPHIPERVSKCTCTQLHRGQEAHDRGCPGDPAEWGDMAYT